MTGKAELTKDGAVAWLRFSNPDEGLMDGAMEAGLLAAIEDMEADETIRVCVLTGADAGVFIRHYDVKVLHERAEAMRAKGYEFTEDRPVPEGGIHTAHIHPHSVISGTTYVAMPPGTSAIKYEDPRLPMMMAAPPRKKDAPEDLRQFVYVAPEVGDVLLWESWLRHEVPMNMAEDERISVSFNYKWE